MAQGKLTLSRLFLLLLALIAPALANAQAARTEPPKPYVPALWEVQMGKSRAYLFGTVHTLPRGVDWFKPHVARALDGSTRLVLETEIPESPAALAPVVMRLSRLSAARPVKDRVPASWQPALQAAIGRLNAPPMEWNDTWFITLTLANLQAEADGLDPRIGVEAVLTERARMRNLPISALETVEEQLTNFDSLPEADQQMMLMSTLEALPRSKANMTLMIGDWMLGDTDALAARVNAEFERSPMLRRLLVEDRNIRWADWLQMRMKAEEGPIFVAVGAGHLAGRGSLVEELEKRGMKVARVAPEPPQTDRKKRRKR
ncbi:TraB/GumN family protein [Sandaracinobacter sp. RS1-74]|uniref:TraB/GumN family protein n=1 Tax=Sandaracinobacteroides sayramensis TaxID=2913411 RepID=UPI001EDACAF1|nr:TraB/GumN family protein [Sandaracinobacteroides sayramensis]MCG2840290.1 TraB/GumN family protein [Sandaracinobacteroides sayramensis]